MALFSKTEARIVSVRDFFYLNSDDEVSSVNGFESPRDLQAKVEAGKPLRSAKLELEAMRACDYDIKDPVPSAAEEIETMESWDFDVGSARQVGISKQQDGVHQGEFASPYWEASARKALAEQSPQSFYEDFDDALGGVMNTMPSTNPRLKACLLEVMSKLLVSEEAKRAFVCWYGDFRDSFAEVWIDEPDKLLIAEDALASLVESMKAPAEQVEQLPPAALEPAEPLIPVERPSSKRALEPEAPEPQMEVIMTFKQEQLVPCAPYFEAREPKENDVKSMFKSAKDVRGQKWRTARLQSSKVIPEELVRLVAAVPKSSFILAARDHECVIFYSEDKDIRSGFQITEAMKATLEDLQVDHWSFMHPNSHNKQNVMDAVHQIDDWGTIVAGNMRVQGVKPASKSAGLLSFEECQQELSKLTIGSFQAFVANSKLAHKQGKASRLQQSVLVVQKELGQWLEWSEKTSSTIFNIKDGLIYPEGFLKDHSDLMGYQILPGSKQPVQISLKEFMYTSSCTQKSAFFVGKQGGGKSSIAMSLARLSAVRRHREKIFFSKNFDPVGELTRSGMIKQIGGFVFSDFCWVSLMNTRLMDEDIMAILDVQEPASFKCRYHVGIMEKGIPRFFCVNAGKDRSGSMDHGAWFDEADVSVLGALARGKDLSSFTDKEQAMARRTVIFPITTDDDIALDVKAESAKKEDDFEQLLEAERLYRKQLEE